MKKSKLPKGADTVSFTRIYELDKKKQKKTKLRFTPSTVRTVCDVHKKYTGSTCFRTQLDGIYEGHTQVEKYTITEEELVKSIDRYVKTQYVWDFLTQKKI